MTHRRSYLITPTNNNNNDFEIRWLPLIRIYRALRLSVIELDLYINNTIYNYAYFLI